MSGRPSKIKLYDAMGEMLYAVALADGIVQPDETRKLAEILNAHPWANAIQWSFNYEMDRHPQIEETFRKAMLVFQGYGPSPEYAFLIDALNQLAQASDGVSPEEQRLIDQFHNQLLDHFQALSLEDLKEEPEH